MGVARSCRGAVASVALVIWALPASLALAASAASQNAGGDEVDTSARNLLPVLRESAGENKLDEALRPYGFVTAAMPDGRRVKFAASWYQYLGDMHVRLVFDGGQSLHSASPDDLERLRLTPEQALSIAVDNLRRRYGEPSTSPWIGGLTQVHGRDDDFASSYFLDHEFWRGLQQQHPEGIVAAVPQRGGLVYAPASDEEAVGNLRFSAAALYAGDEGRRVSSALYLFKDGHWSVYQAPQVGLQ